MVKVLSVDPRCRLLYGAAASFFASFLGPLAITALEHHRVLPLGESRLSLAPICSLLYER